MAATATASGRQQERPKMECGLPRATSIKRSTTTTTTTTIIKLTIDDGDHAGSPSNLSPAAAAAAAAAAEEPTASCRRRTGPTAMTPPPAVVVRRELATNEPPYHDNGATTRRRPPPAQRPQQLQLPAQQQHPQQHRGSRQQPRSHQQQQNNKRQFQFQNNNSGIYYNNQRSRDYCNPSDSSNLGELSQQQQQLQLEHNYDQNILLAFATEHDQRQPHPRAGVLDAAAGCKPPLVVGSGCSRTGGSLSRRHQVGATGKFVSHYPAYGLVNSGSRQQGANYSFHVPLRWAAATNSGNNGRPPRPANQSKLSGRSRTIAHLPCSQEDGSSQGEENIQQAPTNNSYEDFYERPESTTTTTKRHYMVLSEGDLLQRPQLMEPMEPSNPFRPGTELSWAADLMVRLMQRGYPVQELPQLVEAAKQVAPPPPPVGEKGEDAKLSASSSWLAPTDQRRASRQDQQPRRGRSVCDLSAAGRRLWASSLERAKSVPRVAPSCDNQQDADSLDRLITSIEQEITEGANEKMEKPATQVVPNSKVNQSNKSSKQDKSKRRKRKTSGQQQQKQQALLAKKSGPCCVIQ